MKIIEAKCKHLDQVRKLFREFQDEIETDCCFQGFEAELKNLPGEYTSPSGALLIAIDEQQNAVACVAIKEKSTDTAELKRLYVRQGFRGTGLGNTLFHTSIAKMKEIGYKAVSLETVPATMQKAYQLYIDFGFRPESEHVMKTLDDHDIHRLYYVFDTDISSNQS